MSLHILAAVANGVLEKLWPSQVPPSDYDLPVQDVEDECWEAVSPDGYYGYAEPNLPPSPVGDRPLSGGRDNPAGADVSPPPSVPAGPSLENWCEPAVLEVLAEHEASDLWHQGRVTCFYGDMRCGQFNDPADWREHVAPQIVAAVLAAVKTWPGQGQQK